MNKMKYFRLRLSDKVRTERPEKTGYSLSAVEHFSSERQTNEDLPSAFPELQTEPKGSSFRE